MRFTMRTVIALVFFTAALVGSQYAFSASLQTAITNLGARLDAKEKIDANAAVADAKVDEAEKRISAEWRATIEKKIDQIERDYKLGDYDLKALISTTKR